MPSPTHDIHSLLQPYISWNSGYFFLCMRFCLSFFLPMVLMKLRTSINSWVHWNSLTFQLNLRGISNNFCWLLYQLSKSLCHAELINFSGILFWSFVFIHTHDEKQIVQSQHQLNPLKASFCITVHGDVLLLAVFWQLGEMTFLAVVMRLCLKRVHQMSCLCKFDYSHQSLRFIFIWT